MDAGTVAPLPESIHPTSFPAKLWRIVNNPANEAICWDSRGEVIIIHQQLFMRHILTESSTSTLDKADRFRTTNFSSFLRQLNLYGFKQTEPAAKDSPNYVHGTFLYYSNKNFKRNKPQHVSKLRRLTFDNKAKLHAGLEVTCRPPSRNQRESGGGDGNHREVRKAGPPIFGHTHQQPAHPYYPHKPQAQMSHNGTPVQPQYLIRVHNDATALPAASSSQYTGLFTGSGAMHIQPSFLACANMANPNFTGFNACAAQEQAAYSPFYHYYHPGMAGSHMTAIGPQTGPYPPHSYQELPNKQNHGVNLDTIFQMADDVMQTPSNNCLVKVEAAEEEDPVLEISSGTCNAPQCSNPAISMEANLMFAQPFLMAVLSNDVATSCGEQEGSVPSVPEQMPEHAIL